MRVYLEDILDSIEQIEKYTGNLTLSEFENNIEKQDAVIRRLEIIGEAVKRLPPELKEKYPKIPWQQIAGLRDVLIHEYAGVLLERVWKVAANDLTILKNTVSEMHTELDT